MGEGTLWIFHPTSKDDFRRFKQSIFSSHIRRTIMKALSIHPAYAMDIFFLMKTVECRTWTTKYRGDILICSTAKKFKDTIPGHALCVVSLKDIVPMERKHLKDAEMAPEEYNPDSYAWLLENVRIIKPFPVKGKLSLWECDHEIEYVEGVNESEEKNDRIFAEIYEPLMYTGDREEW